MIIRHFKKGDLEKINRQEEQLLEGEGDAYDSPDTVVFDDNGKVLVMVRPLFYDKGCMLCALISKDCGSKAVELVKRGKRLIQMLLQDNEFVEITTQVGWLNAERLARVLGFEPDRLEKNYYNGIDFNIWRIA